MGLMDRDYMKSSESQRERNRRINNITDFNESIRKQHTKQKKLDKTINESINFSNKNKKLTTIEHKRNIKWKKRQLDEKRKYNQKKQNNNSIDDIYKTILIFGAMYGIYIFLDYIIKIITNN